MKAEYKIRTCNKLMGPTASNVIYITNKVLHLNLKIVHYKKTNYWRVLPNKQEVLLLSHGFHAHIFF